MTAAEASRLPTEAELTLELEETSTAGLLLPAVQEIREAAARSWTVEMKLSQPDMFFLKCNPSTVKMKVLGSGRQGYSIQLRKS